MSLFIRVNTNFFTNRKTARLRARIGNDALWLLPRLWAYAAENQEDGILSGYEAQELANLIGYDGDAPSMLQALLDVGFLDPDPLRIHDWYEHNSYHVNYKLRASAAAKARWEKARIRDERRGEETSIASSMLGASNPPAELPLKDKTLAELAGEIYECYPKKVARPKAIAAIQVALKGKDSQFLRERTKLFFDMVKSGQVEFVPHPTTWFNQERYNDDPSTWRNGKLAHPPIPAPKRQNIPNI